ncbi:S26 family signal peptidase [Microbispora amethystogenes]|uniref:S26 family signal peptidase n=1 Tax=Microbispora amethystogenes TaxID=1427754 RepID=UPI0033E4A90F
MRYFVILLSLAVAAGVVAARRRLVVIRVAGTSMVPTYQPGDRVLIRRGGRAALRRGQVVVFRRRPPDGVGRSDGTGLPGGTGRSAVLGETSWLIKRIAAVPGDTVPDQVAAGVRAAPGESVPAGRLVVLGDGPVSNDSRHWGYLPMDEVLGVVIRSLSR